MCRKYIGGFGKVQTEVQQLHHAMQESAVSAYDATHGLIPPVHAGLLAIGVIVP